MAWQSYRSSSMPDLVSIEVALKALSADELRALVRDTILWLDEQGRVRLVTGIVGFAARKSIAGSNTADPDWLLEAPDEDTVAEIMAFADAAVAEGHANPMDIEDCLWEASSAFLCKDYLDALRIFRALLFPLGDGEIDLGQEEMLDEVLGANLVDCAAQYVVSVYMTTPPAYRAEAVSMAIDDLNDMGAFEAPLQEMERVAVEPLPGFDTFLVQWRKLVEEYAREEHAHGLRTDTDDWLREVVQRMEGSDGLARLARSTGRVGDLRAWCQTLTEAGDWKSALSACEEAAERVTDHAHARGEFLDGAALATHELGAADLPERLERAWRADPDMIRLLRWLGTASSKAAVKKRAARALEICPDGASRQRGFLHALRGEFEAAATLLATAPGLGWSNNEHPGSLLFPLFGALLGATDAWSALAAHTSREQRLMYFSGHKPRLATPDIQTIIKLAGVSLPKRGKARDVVLAAMRAAAEKRMAGVTENKRRRHYGHAAQLVAACASLDPSTETARWVADLRAGYRRYPALKSELDSYLSRI